jgi:hypothetical protein
MAYWTRCDEAPAPSGRRRSLVSSTLSGLRPDGTVRAPQLGIIIRRRQMKSKTSIRKATPRKPARNLAPKDSDIKGGLNFTKIEYQYLPQKG